MKSIFETDFKRHSELLRSKRSSNIQRALYFQVKGSQYIITNAFTKKTQKTPENEKQIARNRRSQYLNKEENQWVNLMHTLLNVVKKILNLHKLLSKKILI
nr:type II toxin-antitoxin system RelE/ParE family toxin [Leuconostoc mesenteroides]